MSSRVSKIDTGVGVSFIASAVIHLAVFLLLVWWGRQFPPQMAIQETYYVDVVNLPVANPRSGSSAQKPSEAETAPPPAPATPMTAPTPSRPATKIGAKSVKPPVPQESAETESAFAERMAKLEGKAEAQQYEEKMKRLSNRTKTGSNTKVGAPNAVGSEAGSRCLDYIKSRLVDALKVTISYKTKKPRVNVSLFIAADGKLSQMKILESSGDAAFELAVMRAIDLANQKFTAPQGCTGYKFKSTFYPEEVLNGPTR